MTDTTMLARLPPRPAQGRRRARRRLRRARRARSPPQARARRRARRSLPDAARQLYRGAAGRLGHRLLRQDRRRPGRRCRHRADRRRRARPAVREGRGGDGRHRAHRQPGRRQRQHRPPAAAARRCAMPPPRRGASWSRWRRRSSACRPTSSPSRDGVVSVMDDADEARHLWRAHRRPLFPRAMLNGTARSATTWSPPARPSRKRPDQIQSRRQVVPAPRHRRQGVRPLDLCHRHQGAGHAAWPHHPPAGRRRGADRGRRSLDQAPFPARASCGSRASSASSPTRNGTRSAPRGSSRSPGRSPRRPSPSYADLYDHIRKAPVRKREEPVEARQCRRRASPAPRASSRRNMNGRSSRIPAWARPAPSAR